MIGNPACRVQERNSSRGFTRRRGDGGRRPVRHSFGGTADPALRSRGDVDNAHAASVRHITSRWGGRLAFTRGAYIAGRCADGRRPVRGSFGGTANPALRSRGRGQCPRCFCASYYRPMGADDSRSRAGPSQLLGREHTKLLEPQRQLSLVRGRARLIFCRSHIDSPCWSERLLVVLATMDLAIAVVAGHGAALPSAMRAVAQLISR
jgi:hypothetical protein